MDQPAVNAKPRKAAGPDPIDVEVGQRLRARRRATGVTQSGLAETLNLSFQQVQKYERGYNRVSASVLVRCARALKCTVADLLGETPDNWSGMQPDDSITEAERAEFLKAFVAVPHDERRVLIRLMGSIGRPQRVHRSSDRLVG
jgi:transcriptional regulator with XRE-family HTH domain